ncbi:hypothetical protein ROHU_011868 [Labeo rohita]|uniref:Uncharacterized protein n=1 Tax=Labeo rohita TaxID=84645 RepID=A0A498LH40_LABRO|nr:hypothetical protein ROHU_011868 [Labeo rohita]
MSASCASLTGRPSTSQALPRYAEAPQTHCICSVWPRQSVQFSTICWACTYAPQKAIRLSVLTRVVLAPCCRYPQCGVVLTNALLGDTKHCAALKGQMEWQRAHASGHDRSRTLFPIILLFSPLLFLSSFLSRLPPASPCAATHLGGVLLSDNGNGRARSGYPPPVMLKWDLGCARAEEVITDQGGLVLKRS